MEWLGAAIVVVVLGVVFWQVFVRGKRGASPAWSLSAGVAGIVAGSRKASKPNAPGRW
jgi:TRAP-type C4-dicarboxylate transport system permease small subunit